MELEEKLLWGLVIGMLLLIFFAIFTAIQTNRLQRFCYSKGYPQSSFSYYYESYCIKRLDQSDIVTPVKELQ